MPYYTCDGPSGEHGKWFRKCGKRKSSAPAVQLNLGGANESGVPEAEDVWEELPVGFDILSVKWAERNQYRYTGPEVIYMFWAKHGPCQREGCGHRTPIMSTPIVATKVLTVGSWLDYECAECRKTFDVERHSARIAPDSPLFVAPTEKLFATMDGSGQFSWDTPAIRWMTYMTGSKTMQDSEGKRLKGTESASICLQLYRMYRKLRKKTQQEKLLKSFILCEIEWSWREDLNLRPPGPEPGALPG